MKIASVNQYSINTNFKGWNERKLNILGRNSEQMRELGLIFQSASYEKMYDASRIHWIFGALNQGKTIESFIKLIEAVDAVKKEKSDYGMEIKILRAVAKLEKKLAPKAEKDIKMLSNKIKKIEQKQNKYDDYYTPDPERPSDSEPSKPITYEEATEWLSRI